MNCQEFEANINDLARDQIIDAASRASALAHSEGCAECAARLADERMLSAGLRHLAASANTEQAPARIETALLAVFRERNDMQKQTVVTPINRTPINRTPINRRRLSRWAIAAAAAVLILVALVALRASQSLPEQVQEANAAQPAPEIAPPAPEKESPKKKNSVAPVNPKRNLQSYSAAARPRRAAPQPQAVNAKENAKDAAGDYEITTDFIPLPHRGSIAELEGGQVLRVELPRSSLASFGLPVNLERAGERIKADVVVGNDGMARAIRFVR